MNRSFNQKGLSMIEILIGLALFSIVGFIVGQLAINSSKVQADAEVSSEKNRLIMATIRTLQDPKQCYKLLKCKLGTEATCMTYSGSSEANMTLYDFDGREGFNLSGTTEINQKIQMTKLTIRQVVPPKSYQVKMLSLGDVSKKSYSKSIGIVRVEMNVDGVPMIPLSVPFLYWTDASNRLRTCAEDPTTMGSPDLVQGNLCESVGGITQPDGSCEMAPLFGGCKYGGAFSRIGGTNCTTGNAFTGNQCVCPQGFSTRTLIDYAPTKSAVLEVIQCVKCVGFSAGGSVTSSAPTFDEDSLDSLYSGYTTASSTAPPACPTGQTSVYSGSAWVCVSSSTISASPTTTLVSPPVPAAGSRACDAGTESAACLSCTDKYGWTDYCVTFPDFGSMDFSGVF
ncbi:MAG: hypothetical protein COT73_05925 [Bdellovibrio sp. CG10_big_fil_rev_8_21_14_0_10_47_8]|nr:MAG: hypothetical protein COT73_05925 [Bdellovibrio sp. CG10_big_fil_rev_8_21_14_0_10_47_8]